MKSLRIILTMSTLLLSSNIILSEHYGYHGGENKAHTPRSHQRRSRENESRNRGNRHNRRFDNHRSRHNRNFYNEE